MMCYGNLALVSPVLFSPLPQPGHRGSIFLNAEREDAKHNFALSIPGRSKQKSVGFLFFRNQTFR
jgi:hypothetical protein